MRTFLGAGMLGSPSAPPVSLMSQTSASAGTQWWLSHIEFHQCFPFRKKRNIDQNLQFPHPLRRGRGEKQLAGLEFHGRGHSKLLRCFGRLTTNRIMLSSFPDLQ
jgi:hypothetical protein